MLHLPFPQSMLLLTICIVSLNSTPILAIYSSISLHLCVASSFSFFMASRLPCTSPSSDFKISMLLFNCSSTEVFSPSTSSNLKKRLISYQLLVRTVQTHLIKELYRITSLKKMNNSKYFLI